MSLKSWRPFEIAWLATFVLLGTGITLISRDSLLNYITLITGILCVLLAAKGHIWTYIYGTVNTVTYAYVAYSNGLFGEMGLNLLFFMPMNVVGFLMWKRHMHEERVDMRGLTRRSQLMLFAGCVLSIGLLGYLLALINGQNTPYIDATTNVLSIIATFLMVYRFKEQWLLYMALNVFTIAMWAIRLAHGSNDGIMMVTMWFAYLINSVYGWYNWSKHAAAAEAVPA